MGNNMLIIILALALAGAAAALLVVIAKWQEEREKRWDEISRAVGLENELERSKAREKCTAKSVQWYADQLIDCERKRRYENRRNRAMQDRLSAYLCPHNDHVWKDGRCVKCGRVKDGWGCSDECPCSL